MKFRVTICTCFYLFILNVCSIQQFPMKENRTGAQIIEFLTKRVNALGAKQCGTFLVDCETYASIPQLGELQQKYKIILHLVKIN